MGEKMKTNIKKFILSLDEPLHYALKVKAARDKTTMNAVVIKAISDYIGYMLKSLEK
jgi:predicted HicB family RNase H-like nuclease